MGERERESDRQRKKERGGTKKLIEIRNNYVTILIRDTHFAMFIKDVHFAKEPYKRDCILQKRPIILRNAYVAILIRDTHFAMVIKVAHFDMGWLRLVGSLKLQVSFAKEPYKRDYILQKKPIILRSLLIVATPYF